MTDEEKITKEDAAKSSDDGNESKNLSIVERAEQATKGLKEQLDRREEILRREQELQAVKALSGKADVSPKEEKHEETPAEYAQKIASGKI